jgi:hypothetical protein
VQSDHRPAQAGLLAVAITYAWWATSLRPFSAPCLWATGAGGAAAVAVGLRGPRRERAPRPRRERARAGRALWAVLLVALCGWELASFVQHPRAAHPTISSLANGVLGHHPARAAAMVLWLVIGVDLGRP